MNGWRLALGFLTVIPVRPVASIGRRDAAMAMLVAPLAVAPVALVAGGLGWAAARLGLPELLVGVATTGAMVLGTRAMHLDGLADTVDGLGSGPDRAKALRVMRTGDVGPMGVVALVLVLLAQTAAAGVIVSRSGGWLQLAALLCASRAALPLGCVTGIPAARPEGLGSLFAGSVSRPALIAGWLLVAGSLSGVAAAVGQPWWLGVTAAAAAAISAGWLLATSVRRFGGITGDVLGALVEVSATCLLIVGSIGLGA